MFVTYFWSFLLQVGHGLFEVIQQQDFYFEIKEFELTVYFKCNMIRMWPIELEKIRIKS